VIRSSPEISSILFVIALVTGTIWMTGEHALVCLQMETFSLANHRDKLGIVFLLSVIAFLANIFASDAS
jgi:hypothetical protein